MALMTKGNVKEEKLGINGSPMVLNSPMIPTRKKKREKHKSRVAMVAFLAVALDKYAATKREAGAAKIAKVGLAGSGKGFLADILFKTNTKLNA